MGSYANNLRETRMSYESFFKDCAPRCLLRTFVSLLQKRGVNSRKSAPKLGRGTGMHNPISKGKIERDTGTTTNRERATNHNQTINA